MRSRLSLLAIAVLAFSGCQAGMPLSEPASFAASAPVADANGSWMLPEAKTSDLLYISTLNTSISIFSYPELVQVGYIASGAYYVRGLCVDSQGDIFVPGWNPGRTDTHPPIGVVLKYAHGATKPSATLKDSRARNSSCAVDPTTGNLAVTNTSQFGHSRGDVAIYKNGSGKPTNYDVPNVVPEWSAYDTAGNLFVDGTAFTDDSSSVPSYLEELPKGSSTFESVTFAKSITMQSLQWVGDQLTIAGRTNDNYETIYRATIAGLSGTIVGTTKLAGRHKFTEGSQQYWIQGTRVLGSGWQNWLQAWPYPQGGKAAQRLQHWLGYIYGVAISPAPKHPRS